MALFIFTKAITEDKKIDVFNYGMMSRDFTYIDDIVEGITRLVPKAPESGDSNALGTKAPYRLFNIGYGSPVKLMDFIEEIEHNLGIRADKNLQDRKRSDVLITKSEVDNLFILLYIYSI